MSNSSWDMGFLEGRASFFPAPSIFLCLWVTACCRKKGCHPEVLSQSPVVSLRTRGGSSPHADVVSGPARAATPWQVKRSQPFS